MREGADEEMIPGGGCKRSTWWAALLVGAAAVWLVAVNVHIEFLNPSRCSVAPTRCSGTLDNARAVLLSIGSESRPGPQKAQREKLGGWVELIHYTEVNVPPCVVCNASTHKGAKHPVLYSSRMHEPAGWWCAQKRPVAALYDALQKLGDNLPRALIIVDDDTFVNPLNLENWLKASPKEYWDEPRYMGDGRIPEMVMGGGGSVLSRGAIKAFKGSTEDWAPLRWCLEQTQGGDWCLWHSDWAIGMCFIKWTNSYATNMMHLFTQDCDSCTEEHIMCHCRKTYEDWMATWDALVTPSLRDRGLA